MRKARCWYVVFLFVLGSLLAITRPCSVDAHGGMDLLPVERIATIKDLVLEQSCESLPVPPFQICDEADVYYPDLPWTPKEFPIVAVLQGAGVDKAFYSEFGTQLARFGFVVVIPNHFQSIPFPPFTLLFPEQDVIQDVLAQMELEDIDPGSELFGIVDTTRMGLGGHSAGGAASLFAINGSCFPPFCVPSTIPPTYDLPPAVRVGAFYGTNTCGVGGDAKDPACITFDSTPPNPTGMLFTIDNNNIPVALVQGIQDGIATPSEAQATFNVLAALRKLIPIDGANHYGITDVNNPPGAVPDFSPPLIAQAEAVMQIALASGQFLSTYLKGEQIPGEFPVYASKLDVDNEVFLNAELVAEGKTETDSAIDIEGNREIVSQVLPKLVPAVFPPNPSEVKIKVSSEDQPFVSDTAVFFKEVEIEKEQSGSFRGGPFHIDKLKIKKGALLSLGAGTYFVNTLEMKDDDAQIDITSEPVTLHIGDKFKVDAKQLILNAGGATAGFLVYLHQDAEFKAKEMDFTGVLYGPYSKKIEVEQATVQGALITSGDVKLKKKSAITYTESDQASVSATIITPGDCLDSGTNGDSYDCLPGQ